MDKKDIAVALGSIHDMTPNLWPLVEKACETARANGFRILGPEHLIHAFLAHPALAKMIAMVGGEPAGVRASLESAFRDNAMIHGPVSEVESVAPSLVLLSRDIEDACDASPGRDSGEIVLDILTGLMGAADGSAIAETALADGKAAALLRDRNDATFFESCFDYLDFAPETAPRATISSVAAGIAGRIDHSAAEGKPDTSFLEPGQDYPIDEIFPESSSKGLAALGASAQPARPEPARPPLTGKPAAGGKTDGKADEVAEAVNAALRDLGAAAAQGELDPCVGRDHVIDQILSTLRRRRKGSVLLYGEAGVGKTAIAEGLAQRLRAGDIERSLAERPFYELSMGDMVAGTKFRGDFEARMKHLIGRLRTEKAIVFIDELHMLVGSGSTYGRGMDGANLFKPALARGEVTIVGATTPVEMRQLRQDKALMRRFHPIAVDEPTRAEVEEILERASCIYLEHHKLEIEEGVIAEICRITDLYQPESHFPDKAFDLLDAACVKARELAAVPRRQLAPPSVSLLHVRAAASALGIRRPGRPHPAVASRLAGLPETLGREVRGQKEAIRRLADAAVTATLNLDPSGPRMSTLLTGEAGCGKGTLVRSFARAMGLPFVRIDMRNCQDRVGLAHLTGLPGQQAFERPGLLVEAADANKDMVLFLDGVQHADQGVHDLLASLVDTGMIQSGDGRQVSLRGAWLFLSVETGSQEMRIGFGEGPEPAARAAEAARKLLSAELVESFSCRLHLGPVAKDHLRAILRDSLDGLVLRCAEFGAAFECPDEVVEALLARCRSPREAASQAEAVLGAQLSRALLTTPDGGTIVASLDATGEILVAGHSRRRR